MPALFRSRISPHQLGLSDLLASALFTGDLPGKLVLLGVEPKEIETGLELSAEVGRGVLELVDLLARELAELGLQVTRREPQPAKETLKNGMLAAHDMIAWDGFRRGRMTLIPYNDN